MEPHRNRTFEVSNISFYSDLAVIDRGLMQNKYFLFLYLYIILFDLDDARRLSYRRLWL